MTIFSSSHNHKMIQSLWFIIRVTVNRGNIDSIMILVWFICDRKWSIRNGVGKSSVCGLSNISLDNELSSSRGEIAIIGITHNFNDEFLLASISWISRTGSTSSRTFENYSSFWTNSDLFGSNSLFIKTARASLSLASDKMFIFNHIL